MGALLCYALVVDDTMLVLLSSISTEQAKITQVMAIVVTQLLNCAATHSESMTRYYLIGMVFCIHSDSSFLSNPVYNIIAGGYNYLIVQSLDPSKPAVKKSPLN